MRKLVIVSALMLSACAKPALDITTYQVRAQSESLVVRENDLGVQLLMPQSGVYPDLRVYIEGDGRAWITSSRPSNDPTPTHSLVLELYSHENQPTAYLARPCQFVMASGCEQRLWTNERFSLPVVEVMDQALQTLKKRFQVERFELVGYSGGAAIALLLAQRRSDIAQIQTIAGNLAPTAWTSLKKLSPLSGSLDPTDNPAQLRPLPQRHWIGVNDEVVPKEVLHAYKARVRALCLEQVTVAADHWHGYLEPWRDGKDQPIQCQ